MSESPYKETVSRTATADYAHKKIYAGDNSGEYARVILRIQPLDRGQGFVFINEILDDAIPARWIGSIENGVRAAASAGVLNGGPVVDCRVTLCGGNYHDIDSSDHAFNAAAQGAFWRAMRNAGPKILYF